MTSVYDRGQLCSRAKRIIAHTAFVFGVTQEEILSPSRRNKAMLARRACAAIMVTKFKWSYSRTGRALNRDHTTIIVAVRRYHELNNQKFLLDVETIVQRLENSASLLRSEGNVEETNSSTNTKSVNPQSEKPQDKSKEIAVIPRKRRECAEQIYAEAKIPPEWDEAFLKALRQESLRGYGGQHVQE